ncbi:carbohydrate sulfotransferase 13-like [Penaeus monodon]|uniref:carbohydrate sulfotransferase 13-like n=1 Tax=Penaeus monodon TaxID=6687 RepID=UPI0018A6F250|nr:carbohydrate sulfotransferase 13-like [Penaeus monodon]
MALIVSLLKKGSIMLLVLLCMSLYSHLNTMKPKTMMVEEAALPMNWFPTQDLQERLAHRRQRVNEVCHQYGFNHFINSKEFLVNKKHGLVWCNVFKAAFFGTLTFGTDNTIANISSRNTILCLTSPSVRLDEQSLRAVLQSSPPPLAFMIARHPFIRLVSAYRDKIARYAPPYQNLRHRIMKAHPELGVGTSVMLLGILFGQRQYPTFPQFVQYVLDRYRSKLPLNEHWETMFKYCTPCQANFTVFAKVETLDEDSSYIMHASGIQGLLKPKIINRGPEGSSEKVAKHFLCQLSKRQIRGLISLYKFDLEMFEYDAKMYLDCASE